MLINTVHHIKPSIPTYSMNMSHKDSKKKIKICVNNSPKPPYLFTLSTYSSISYT